ncbi:DUF2561 family protein [Mycobacterium deserti]|uniref:DUF2561 family protein n=1 Tax=Mycobacterium deserti TaxID=2978347 RepID=A0ABT2MD65_9MYCO|nr:DUF2561 family protein [Mycobacterium deserti]MCT7660213.1 DUF2561 family protein [Mycobacterium deserti]
MTYDTDTTGRSRLSPRLDTGEFDRIDRILLGSCAGIWLVALGTGVAATVALVDLASGDTASSADSDTPWLLYTVIAISAIVIIGAVPLLLRARREAAADVHPQERLDPRPSLGRSQPPEPGVAPAPLRAGGPVIGRPSAAAPVNVLAGAPASPTTAAADQLSLRCALAIACAIGIATVAIGVGTYLMAVGSTVAAWVFLVLAGLVTLAMAAVPWYFLRELRALLDK